MTGNGTILELRGIRKRFGQVEALKGVNLSVQRGEFFGFLGPNGAGKSTLLKIFSGFLPADSGEILIRGEVVRHGDLKARRSCGLVPQELAIYGSLSPLENIAVFGDLYGLSRRQRRARGEDLLHAVGLWDRRNGLVKDFSGGMKRRLNILLSLLHEPEILLCDEPTVGVDPQSRNAIFEFLEARNREGLTVIYTTHYMEEAERLCRRISIIDHGRVLACDSLEGLLALSKNRQELQIAKGPGVDAVIARIRPLGELIEDELLYRMTPHPDTRLSHIYAAVEEAGLAGVRVQVRTPSLEGLFLELTGHRLRD